MFIWNAQAQEKEPAASWETAGGSKMRFHGMPLEEIRLLHER